MKKLVEDTIIKRDIKRMNDLMSETMKLEGGRGGEPDKKNSKLSKNILRKMKGNSG